ncbi:MAG: hypothetical protein IJS13_06660 [Paludibacteraceae bacterium]|nr:hypothetical protein [Paludibacteraceae bacterium]
MKNAQLPFLLMTFFVLPSVASASDYERNETTHYFDYTGTPLDTDLEVDFSELTSDMVAYSSGTTHSETILEFQGLGLYKYCYYASRTLGENTYAPLLWNSGKSYVAGEEKNNKDVENVYDLPAVYFPEFKDGIRYIAFEGWGVNNPANITFMKQADDGTWSNIATKSLSKNSYTRDTIFINNRNVKRVMFHRITANNAYQYITKITVATYSPKEWIYNSTSGRYDYTGTPQTDTLVVDFSGLTEREHKTHDGSNVFAEETLAEFNHVGLYKFGWYSSRTCEDVAYSPVLWSCGNSYYNGVSTNNTAITVVCRPAIYLPTIQNGIKKIIIEGWTNGATAYPLNIMAKQNGTWKNLNSINSSYPGTVSLQGNKYSRDTIVIDNTEVKDVLFTRSSTAYQFITKITIIPIPNIVIAEDADNSELLAEYNGEKVNLTVHRTIKAGMYNTFCLPCDVSGSRLKEALGVSECSLKWFNAASMAGEAIDMQFTTASSVQAGAPYLIKTNEDVTESFILRDVVIKNTTRHIDKPSGTPLVKFYGTFNPTPLSTSRNTLVLGANSTLYYVDHDLTMDGMRGYFQLTGTAAAAAPQVRIRYMEDTATDTEAAEGNPQNSIKVIRDGQLLIIRDGVMYNTLGQTINK